MYVKVLLMIDKILIIIWFILRPKFYLHFFLSLKENFYLIMIQSYIEEKQKLGQLKTQPLILRRYKNLK